MPERNSGRRLGWMPETRWRQCALGDARHASSSACRTKPALPMSEMAEAVGSRQLTYGEAVWTCFGLVERRWISWRPSSRTGPGL